MTIKDGLRQVVRATREKEATELLPRCDDAPPPARQWSAKDNLAHMAVWREHAAAILEGSRTGSEVRSWSGDIDAENERILEETRALSAAQVRERVRTSWEALSDAVEACSEEVLLSPRRAYPDRKTWQVVPGNTHLHLAEHLGYWHREHGDEAAAEAAAKWADELHRAAFPDSHLY